ncbi:MAG TPA: hypothetical protein VHS78_01365 [Candidatus Elarobacter sp.]|nr:hypothetical protein [Candidatus Elarobacter sp.]
MRVIYRALGAAAGIAILAACSSGQSAIQPPSSSVNVQNTTVLQFRVGTARYANGSTYLNTLTTYRQPNGLSATLYNSPTITGPTGFVVPAAGSAGTDAGTNHISSTPPTQPGTPAVATTFGQSGGVFSYGFAPANSTTSGAANYTKFSATSATNNGLTADWESTIIVGTGKGNTCGNIYGDCDTTAPPNPANTANEAGAYLNTYMQPFYIPVYNKLPFLLGPPAVPDFHNPSAGYPAGFLGYDSGFTMFGAAPVVGTYTLTVNVPSANVGQLAASFTQTANLGSTTPPIGVVTTPIITPVAGGGASFTVAPAPGGATNQVLYVVRFSGSSGTPTHYSFSVGTAGGTVTLGPTAGPAGAAPFKVGDSVYAYVVAADWDIVGLAPPVNTQQAPSLPATADISVSTVNEIAY